MRSPDQTILLYGMDSLRYMYISYNHDPYRSSTAVDDNVPLVIFLQAHISEGSKFDFQKFLSRALDKDFEVVVGIR